MCHGHFGCHVYPSISWADFAVCQGGGGSGQKVVIPVRVPYGAVFVEVYPNADTKFFFCHCRRGTRRSFFREDSETPSGILMLLATKRGGMNNAGEILCRHTLQVKTPCCGCFIDNAMYKGICGRVTPAGRTPCTRRRDEPRHDTSWRRGLRLGAKGRFQVPPGSGCVFSGMAVHFPVDRGHDGYR